mmetsp:Transcript_17441/g.57694  ORF Transcript_17441/g.57694 Transcript_17441/m.57694 type:complete len:224 (-) Transcript_17441:488-1159(-)
MLKLENEIHTRFMMEMIENEEDENTNLSVFYNDVRNFGTLTFSLDPAELENKLASIGPAFLDGLTASEFIKIAKRQKKSRFLAVFLMDQKKTSGIGNYILSECLYKSNLDPWLLVGDLNEDQWMDLFHAIQETIYESYKSSGVSRRGADGVKRIGMYEGLDGEAGHYTDKLLVYGRKEDVHGRTVFREDGPHKRAIWFVKDQITPRGKENRRRYFAGKTAETI